MIAAPLIAAALLGSPASVGVGITGAPVCLPSAVQSGHSYSLGTVYIVNTGSGSEDITLHAGSPVNHLPGKAFPGSWVTFGYPKTLWVFGGSSVTLSPGQGADIPATLNVPAGTKPGLYASDLLAGTMSATPSGPGGHAVFGAGAETNMQFAVAPAKAPSCGGAPVVAKVPGAQYSPAASQGSAGRTKPNGWVVIAIVAFVLFVGFNLRVGRR